MTGPVANHASMVGAKRADAKPSKQPPGEVALWLDEHEAATLLKLCLCSPDLRGSAEETLLNKLGETLRLFGG